MTRMTSILILDYLNAFTTQNSLIASISKHTLFPRRTKLSKERKFRGLSYGTDDDSTVLKIQFHFIFTGKIHTTGVSTNPIKLTLKKT